MIASISIYPEEWYKSVHELFRSALIDYQIFFTPQEQADIFLDLAIIIKEEEVCFQGKLQDAARKTLNQKVQFHTFKDEAKEHKNELSRLLRIFVFEWMCEFLGRSFSEYGILSGVRPLKILHRCLDQHWRRDDILSYLKENFRVSSEKAAFLLEVAENNHFLLHSPEEAKRKIGIYVGIPYCPTRCYYCSFPGAILHQYEQEIPPFLEALQREISGIGDYLQAHDYLIQNVYIGGGTPTVLNEKDLLLLLRMIRENLNLSHCQEITIEAGRPDTLNTQKFYLMKENHVDRICINPQTMNNATLERIGRRHTAEQIEEMVIKAREIGIEEINMDLIVGLMGESDKEYQQTLKRVLALQPTNITLHSLAVKRGSVLAEKEGLRTISGQAEEIVAAMKKMSAALRQQGYIPYYLYRQKYMKANMENTGYTLPGKQCLYNVQMMEERQTILGLGGGASSKFVFPENWTLTSFHNPKDPKSYTEHVERCIQGKLDNLKAFL